MASAAMTGSKAAVRFEFSPAGCGMPVHLSVYTGEMTFRDRADYFVSRIPADFGVGVHFHKMWDKNDFSSSDYDVNLDMYHGMHECECLGFLRRGHCRHVDAAIQMFDAGCLSESTRPEHAEELPAKAERVEDEDAALWDRLREIEPATYRRLRRARLNDGELLRAVKSAEFHRESPEEMEAI